jgi:hypothetical protein
MLTIFFITMIMNSAVSAARTMTITPTWIMRLSKEAKNSERLLPVYSTPIISPLLVPDGS